MTEEPGVEYFLFDKSVTLVNAGTATLPSMIYHVVYNTTTIFGPSSVASKRSGETVTFSDLATDGKHIWVFFDRVSMVTYNGYPVNYKKSEGKWQIEIPDNFDPSIPFVFA